MDLGVHLLNNKIYYKNYYNKLFKVLILYIRNNLSKDVFFYG